MSSCVSPVHPEDIFGDDRWMCMHNRFVSETKTSEPDVVFIGDSIIQGLQFSNLWIEKISSLHCLNFGIGGDRVQHVLWRILNGEMDFNVSIKAVVLFVGTNNIEDKPEDVFAGIVECIKGIKNKVGDVHIVVPTLLPRGQNPNELRDKNNQVNKLLLEQLSDKPARELNHIHVVPIHENVTQSDGTISHYLMYDYLHLSDSGYTKTFSPIYDKLCSIVHVHK